MKHAYLIIAHHEFEVLQKLLDVIDDERNDIYIHVDKKVKKLPVLNSEESSLTIIQNRVDVRWGHVSQIETEYVLFEAAYHSGNTYEYFHLISGTHMPLKTQDYIHDVFGVLNGKEVLNYLYTDSYEAKFKINRFHFFLRNYKSSQPLIARASQLMWNVFMKIQKIFDIHHHKIDVSTKANNWVSLTQSAVAYIISEKERVLKQFRYSFCGDEFFVPYLLEKANGRFAIHDERRLLFNDFIGGTPRTITEDDFDFLINSEYLFARKFSNSEVSVIDRVVHHINLSKS